MSGMVLGSGRRSRCLKVLEPVPRERGGCLSLARGRGTYDGASQLLWFAEGGPVCVWRGGISLRFVCRTVRRRVRFCCCFARLIIDGRMDWMMKHFLTCALGLAPLLEAPRRLQAAGAGCRSHLDRQWRFGAASLWPPAYSFAVLSAGLALGALSI